MLDTLENLPDKELRKKQEKERLRFLIAILYFLGLRINELATHIWHSFRKVDDRVSRTQHGAYVSYLIKL